MKKDSRSKEACCVKVTVIKIERRAHSFGPSNASDPQLSHAVTKGGKEEQWLNEIF